MRVGSCAVVCGVLLTGVLSGDAQPGGSKVLIVYDMEGVSGISSYEETTVAHPAEYAEGRRLLTRDVNAAIAGLKAAGATEILIVDGHGSGNDSSPDVLEGELLAPARMLYRDKPFDTYMGSVDKSVDAVVAIGMHTGAGNRQGFLAHTLTFVDVEYRVNGRPINETLLLAMGAARVNVPIVAMSGDDQLEQEIRRDLPWVQFATVKRAITVGEALPAGDAALRIEAAARNGLTQRASARLPQLPGPYQFSLTLQDQEQATSAALVPGAERSGATATIRANDFVDGYTTAWQLIDSARAVNRRFALEAVINAQPNAVALHAQVTDWLYHRMLGTLPVPKALPTAATPLRHWGAQ